MHHITTADRSFLVGSDVAELLMEYAALVAQIRSGDTVKVHAFGADGGDVVATILLNSGSVMAAETVHSSMAEPDNADAEAYLRGRLDSYGPVHEAGFGELGAV